MMTASYMVIIPIMKTVKIVMYDTSNLNLGGGGGGGGGCGN